MKRSVKFLSVLLIVTMCIGFMPSASALSGVVGGGAPAAKNGQAAEDPQATVAPVEDEAVPSPIPEDGGGVVVEDDDPDAEEAEGEEEEDAEGEAYIEVATAKELRAALLNVKTKGTIEVTQSILDLSYPLSITKSVVIDLGGNTLGFTPTDGTQSCAVYIAPGVRSVNIANGTISIGTITDKEGTVTGFESAIISNAGSLRLNVLDITGALLEGGTMLDNANDKGSLDVRSGYYLSDPSAYLSEGYTAELEDGVWVVRKVETEDPETSPEPSEEPQDEAKPSEEPEAQPSQPPMMTIPAGIPMDGMGVDDPQIFDGEGEVDDQYNSVDSANSSPTGLPKIMDVVEDEAALQELAKTGSEYPVVVKGEIQLTETLNVAAGLDLNLSNGSVKGDILVTTEGKLSVDGGSVSGKITNTDSLELVNTVVDEILTSGGSVTLSPASSVVRISVEGGSVLVDGGKVTEKMIISSGSVSLAGAADVAAIGMKGGALSVKGASEVKVGDVTVGGPVTIDIDSGTFGKLQFGSLDGFSLFSAISGPTSYEISGSKVTGGFFTLIADNFIADGYEQTDEYGIMPISADFPVVTPSGDTSEAKTATIYYKYKSGVADIKDKNEAVFDINTEKFTGENLKDNSVDQITLTSCIDNSTQVTLTVGDDDFTCKSNDEKTSCTITLKKDSTNLQRGTVKAGLYDVTFQFKAQDEGLSAKQTHKVEKGLFVHPYIDPASDLIYLDGIEGDQIKLDGPSETYDKPDYVTIGPATTYAYNAKGVSQLRDSDWTASAGSLTINNAYLKSSGLPKGNYYLGLWYGKSHQAGALYIPITIRNAPSVKPGSRDWTYGNGDVSFTVYDEGNKATKVELTAGSPSMTKGTDYTISEDGRTVTIKASFLKDKVVKEATGEGYGLNSFTITTNDGEVKATVNLHPALWAKDDEDTHRKGSDSDLVFECSAPIDPDVVPMLNDNKIGGTKETAADKDGYVINGNTITLKADFLNRRGIMSFKLTVGTKSTNNEAVSTTFKVTGTNSGSGTGVATGDGNDPVVWTVVLVLSGAAVVALIPKKKKQQNAETD